jgi:uncharacterized protein (TIGR00251 family)
VSWRVNERDGGVTFDVLVQPRASRPGVGPAVGDRLRVAVAAAPVDGKANDAVARALAEAFGVARSAVAIVRGQTSRRKTVRIAGLTAAQVLARVGA